MREFKNCFYNKKKNICYNISVQLPYYHGEIILVINLDSKMITRAF